MKPELLRLAATLVGVGCFALAFYFSSDTTVATALLGAGTTVLAAAHVRRPGDAPAPTPNVDGSAGSE
jgi:hypothetical protein